MTEVTCNDEHGYLQLSEKNDHEIFVHTGNLANWSNLKSRKSNDIPMNELHQSYSRTIEKWIEQNGPLSKKEAFVNCFNAKKMDDNERGLLKVTAKIFLQNFNVEAIKEALNLTLTQLGLKYIDGVYLSLPPLPQNATFSETMLPFWEELERLRDAGLVTQISSCDLDREKLKTLVDIVRVKPEVNQVNLASCCHMPEDLVSYAKETGIVLHTHCDHQIMLSDEIMNELICSVDKEQKNTYSSDWLVRYAVVIKCRGVIKNKGYIVSMKSQENEKNGTNGNHAA